jgi:hypothetical protein
MFPLLSYLSRADLSQTLRSQFLWPNWRGNWILGRHACLGRDVFDLADSNWPVFNIQKGRVDYLISAIQQKIKSTRTVEMAPFLCREDIIPFLRQQEYCRSLPKHPPKLVYMDSFAELTDQLFIHKIEGWGGCCCYGDINHTKDFKKIFREEGLLDIDNLESSYRDFFNLIRSRYGEVPIVFLHFPSALETRPKYLERGRAIFSIIEKLRNEYRGLYSISINESIVSQPIEVAPELKDFPYHYNKETYLAFSKILNEIFFKIKHNSN